MTQDINRELHEALGLKWHEKKIAPISPTEALCSCGFLFGKGNISTHIRKSNPDYCEDPRLVIEAMQKRGDFDEFLIFVEHRCWYDAYPWIDLFTDKTGKLAKLAKLAIEFLKGGK